MSVSGDPRIPRSQVHEVAFQRIEQGGIDFTPNDQAPFNTGFQKISGGVEPPTPGQAAAGSKGALTVMSTRGHLGLQATGTVGSSLDFMKPPR